MENNPQDGTVKVIGIQPRLLKRSLLVGTVAKSQMKLHQLDGVMPIVLKVDLMKET